MKSLTVLAVAVLAAMTGGSVQPAAAQAAPDVTFEGYPPAADPTPSKDRITVRVTKSEIGTSRTVDDRYLIAFCADLDGCTVRIGMYNWDNGGQVASRETLFFLNSANRKWRASAGDTAGTDGDAVIQHVITAYSCYFTDGQYKNRTGQDNTAGFELLSWTNYTAECWLTIID